VTKILLSIILQISGLSQSSISCETTTTAVIHQHCEWLTFRTRSIARNTFSWLVHFARAAGTDASSALREQVS